MVLDVTIPVSGRLSSVNAVSSESIFQSAFSDVKIYASP